MRLHAAPLLIVLVAAFHVPSPAEAQVSDVDCVAIFDSDGNRVARSQVPTSSGGVFHMGHNGFAVPLYMDDQTINGSVGFLRFTDTSCLSTPFIQPISGGSVGPESAVIGQEVYYTEAPSDTQAVQLRSRLNLSSGVCQTENAIDEVTPALGQFSLPAFTPPFHLEPEACYTPDPSVAALTPYGLGAMAFVFAFGAYVMKKRHSATVDID
jgi:hypothetical protein